MKRIILAGYFGCRVLSVHAQEAPVDLGEMAVSVSGDDQEISTTEATTSSYESFDPIDSGRSVIDSKTVESGREGGNDTTALLQSLPFVQMDTERQSADPDDIQSIRPSDFSISGGNYYDNNIQIDGVSATSIMDVSTQNRNDYNEVFGQTSQTLYVDPSLIGSVDVFDSNVSARYGDFTGGVVDYKLRQPARKFGVHVSSGLQNDSMISYRKTGHGEVSKQKPDFTKYQSSLAVDLPLTDQLFVLASMTRAESAVKNQMSDDYGGQSYESGDTASNYLVKALYEYNPDLNLEAQVLYSPYRSEDQPDDSINSLNVNHTDGFSSYVALNGIRGDQNWHHKLSYQFSDASRDWDGDRYTWPSASNSVNWCSNTNCVEGGNGDLNQLQRDTAYEFSFDSPFAGGEFSAGTELRLTQARKQRPEDNYAYSLGKMMGSKATAACADGDSACRDDVVLSQRTSYSAYDAQVDLFSQALWAEYFREIGDWDFRIGSRLSHDDFLDNYNLAPRLTANWEFMPDTFLTLGGNRYYAANMVGYAIRSQYPDAYTYRRTVNTKTGAIGDWSLYSHSRSTDYGQGDLKTPYSDELTAALTFPAPLNGHWRIKGVYRQNRDSFANTAKTKDSFSSDTGKTLTTYTYDMTNDGKSNYKGLALEWDGHYKTHSFNANITWSATKTYGTGSTYFDYTDPEDMIYYQGNIVGMNDLFDLNSRNNYAAPIRASIAWTAKWTERFQTSTSVQYRGSYQYLGDSGDDIAVDGQSYDVYETIKLPAFTTINLNARYTVFQHQNQSFSVDTRVTNLLNATPHTASTSSSATYRVGRSVWLGANYVY